MLRLLSLSALLLCLNVELFADTNITNSVTELNRTIKETKPKKYEEINKENHITLMEFDEWLIVNEQKEAFVKAYNTSPNHKLVQKLKCMYELNTLFNEEMEFDDLEEKCSKQKDKIDTHTRR